MPKRVVISDTFLSMIDKLWYGRHPLSWLLWPFATLYRVSVSFRRCYLQYFRQQQFPVPIIIVGNLTVGGVGKTPLVIALAKQLSLRGVRVGIVSRGYRANVNHYPYKVSIDDDALFVGDEPLLLAKKTGCPVVIAPKRVDAVQFLLDNYQSQIIISDDGLQHYAMGRAIEIVVIDGLRGLGNGLCLPAGPLRESARRLQQADFIVVNGASSANDHVSRDLAKTLSNGLYSKTYRLALVPGELTSLVSATPINIEELNYPVAAVAAIGNPNRFFATLEALGVAFNPYPFADHHFFHPEELNFVEKIVVMTEKDAVKCQSFATDIMYFLPVDAKVDDKFWDALWVHEQLQGYKDASGSFG